MEGVAVGVVVATIRSKRKIHRRGSSNTSLLLVVVVMGGGGSDEDEDEDDACPAISVCILASLSSLSIDLLHLN